MTRPTRANLIYAVLLSPPVAPAIYATWALAHTFARAARGLEPVPTAHDVRETIGICFVLGGIVAYAATLLVALPVVLWLRHVGRFALRPVIALGAAVGIVAASVLAQQLRGGMFASPLPWWIGAAIGMLCAAVFWMVANGMPTVMRERMESRRT